MIELIKDNIPDIRFLYDMKEVLYDQEWLKTAPNFEIYYMYRGLSQNGKDKEIMEKNNLRYDITILEPKMLGAEFPKTLGHEHTQIEPDGLTYPEIYEILKGDCEFLLQQRNNNNIEDVLVVKVKQGEKLIIPPNYAHFMLNVFDTEIIMANWSEKNFKSDYAPIKEKHGACYYALSASHSVIPSEPSPPVGGRDERRNLDERNIAWIKNKNYDNIPKLKIHPTADFNWLLERFGINPAEPMYNLVNNIEKLDFLKNPQKYKWEK